MIQLAAIKVTLSEDGFLSILESFNELVKPSINPTLSDYISSLTGINQSLIDEMGVDFGSALNAFYRFSEEGQLPCWCWGKDTSVLVENTQLNNLTMPDFAAGFFDLRELARRKGLTGAECESGTLATTLGVPLTGQVHNALFDVKSLLVGLNYWLEEKQLGLDELREEKRQDVGS